MSSAQAGAATSAAPVARIYDPSKKVSVVAYHMERVAQDCVNVFCELSGCAKNRVGTAPAPFLEEANDLVDILEGEPTQPKKKGVSSAQAGTPEGKADVSSAQVRDHRHWHWCVE